MRPSARSLIARLEQHCAQVGINPPRYVLRRYATLRWLDAKWWLHAKLDADRHEVLADIAAGLQLDRLQRGTPLCLPDLPRCIRDSVDLAALADWPDAPLMVGMEDIVG
jgi:hypothetical protein